MILKPREIFGTEISKIATTATEQEISDFQNFKQLRLPHDLIEYFMDFNGTSGEYNDRFFCFYSLNEFKTLKEKFEGWIGVPNYGGILNSLQEHSGCYVFADYHCHLFAYAIRLYGTETFKNEVYAICGNEYGVVANTFTDFIHKYYRDPEGLKF